MEKILYQPKYFPILSNYCVTYSLILLGIPSTDLTVSLSCQNVTDLSNITKILVLNIANPAQLIDYFSVIFTLKLEKEAMTDELELTLRAEYSSLN